MEYLIRHLYIVVLSDISHPIEGTFYLFLLAIVFRWRWPNMWNNLLKNISAPVDQNRSQEDQQKSNLSSPLTDDIASDKNTQSEQ